MDVAWISSGLEDELYRMKTRIGTDMDRRSMLTKIWDGFRSRNAIREEFQRVIQVWAKQVQTLGKAGQFYGRRIRPPSCAA